MLGERQKWILTALAVLIPFLGFWTSGLFDLDEGFYAAVVANMIRSGDWITPMYNGLPWFEKPILLYWLAGPSVLAFGEVVGPRLPSVLVSLGTIATCAYFATQWFSASVGRWTALALGSSLIFVLPGILMLTDAPLVCALSIAMLAYAHSVLHQGKGLLLSGIALGVAVLAKGPVALFLFGGTWIAAYIWHPSYRARLKSKLWLVPLVALAVSCVWFVPAYLASPVDFVEIFILKQNIGRLMGGDDAHGVSWYLYIEYYIVVLGLAMAPWSWFSVLAIKLFKPENERIAFTKGWIIAWAAVVLLLFTASGSKLPHYILPAVPPLALLAGIYLERESKKQSVRVGAALAWLLTCGIALWLPSWYYQKSGQSEAHELARRIRDDGKPVATFQLNARKRSVAMKSTIQETSLPSLHFYLRKPPLELETLPDIANLNSPTWIFTRTNRIGAKELDYLAKRGCRLSMSEPVGENYRIYLLQPVN